MTGQFGWSEPIPATQGVGLLVLLGIEHRTPVFFGQRIHPGAVGKTQRILPAAMQHDDERQSTAGRRTARQVKTVAHLEPGAEFGTNRRAAVFEAPQQKATASELAPGRQAWQPRAAHSPEPTAQRMQQPHFMA